MRDPIDRPEPDPSTPRRATTRQRRPRFALPADHHERDERTSERIEAFLEGPTRTRRSRPRHLRPEALRRPRRVIPLDTRTDWDAALRHEDARFHRYGRPASVLVVDLRVEAAGAADRLAQRVGSVIREHARETDRVARVSQTRFHVLLPETIEVDATALADRVRKACDALVRAGSAGGGTVEIAAAAATPNRGGTLADALRDAQARLDASAVG